MGKSITELKAESTLNKVFRYPEGIMSRREYIKLKKSQGAEVKECMKSKTHFNRKKYNRMSSIEESEAYEKRLETKVLCYELWFDDRSFVDITKAEADYFKIT
jgi:hypothetical protein